MTVKRWKSVGFCAAFLLALSFIPTAPVLADCTESLLSGGNYNGSADANNISCDGEAPNAATNVNGNDGNDTIEIQTGFTVTNNVNGGNDDDTITIMGGSVTANVAGGEGDDTINLNSGSIGGNITGGNGNETVTLTGGTFTGTVQLGAGNAMGFSQVTVNGNFNAANITAGLGDEVILINPAGQIGAINLGAGNTGSTVTVNGISGGITIGAGLDTVSINTTTGQINGNINVGDGGSFVSIQGTVTGNFIGDVGQDLILIATTGTIGQITTGADGDSVEVYGLATGTISTGAGMDIVVIGNGTDSAGAQAINTGTEDDDVTVNNLSITSDINTGDGADFVEMKGQSGNIATGIGNDQVYLANRTNPISAAVTATSGLINLGAGDDTFFANTTGTVNGILGGDGLDLITMIRGIVSSDINAGNDADTIQIFGATSVIGNVSGGANADISSDQISINTGGLITGDVRGGGGDDAITLTLGVISGALQGQDGADTINMFGGSANAVTGGLGEDELNLNGGLVWTNVSGGDDNDTINLAGTTVLGDLNGGLGDDAFNVTGGQASGVVGGDGMDNLAFSGGLILGVVNMGNDDDTVIVSGTANLIGVASWNGGANTDLLQFQGLTADVGTAINWEEIAVVSGADITFSAATYQTLGNGFRVNGATARFAPATTGWSGDWNLQSANVFIQGGVFNITGNLGITNSNLSLVNGTAGDTLGINGNINSAGGILSLDVVLGDDASARDHVQVAGAVSGGPVLISVNNLGGLGAQTTAGIGIVTDPGSVAGDYALAGPAVAGAYAYSLVQNGNDWFLQSTIAGTALAYATTLSVAQNHMSAAMGPLSERMRDLGLADEAGEGQSAALGASDVQLAEGQATQLFGGLALWTKTYGQIGAYSPDNRDGADVTFDQRTFGLAVGAEGGFADVIGAGDRLFIGAMVGYGDSHADLASGAEVGVDGWTSGIYATYRGASDTPFTGFYLDGVAMAGILDANVVDPSLLIDEDYKARSLTASFEAGYGFDLGDALILEPQAQLTWIDVSHDDFTDGAGTTVRLEEGSSLQGRLGLRLQKHWHLYSLGHVAPYLEANVEHEFQAANEISASGVLVDSAMDGTSYSLGMGLDAVVDGVTIFGDVDITWGDAIDQEVQAIAGARVSF